MDFANELEEKIKEGIRGKVEDNGYFEKIAKKVVDNLQVKINNIHVRFEHHDKMRYAHLLKRSSFSRDGFIQILALSKLRVFYIAFCTMYV